MRHGYLTPMLALAWVTASAASAMAQYGVTGPWLSAPTGPVQSSSVKSSKSNTSDRMGGGGGRGTGANTRATTVKSSKSNTSDRMGGGGGGKGGAARATTVKSSKSNTSD